MPRVKRNPKFSKTDQKNLNKLVQANRGNRHYFNDNTILGAIAVGGTVQSMCNVIQAQAAQVGVNIENRIGDTITNCEWDVNYTLVGTVNDSFARVIFFQDHDNIGTPPAVTDLLAVAKVSSSFDVENLDAKRWRIFYDRTHALLTATDNQAQSVHHKKFRCKRISYTGAGSGNEGADSVYCLVIRTDCVTAAVGVANIDLDFTLKFNP